MRTTTRKKKVKTLAAAPIASASKSKKSFMGSSVLIVWEDIPLVLLFFSLLLLFSTQNLVSFTLPKLVALRIGSLLVVLWAGWHVWKGRISPVPKPILYSGAALGLWWTLTTFFALHTPTALDGYFGRYNGLWTHLNYLILFFILASIPMDEKRADRIGWFFIIALIPVSLYSFLQYLQWDPIPWSTRWSRSVSTIGHGVPLAALLGMALPFILIFLFQARSQRMKGCLLVLLLVFIGAILFTLSRGPWIAAFIGAMVVIGLRLKHRSAGNDQAGLKTPMGLPAEKGVRQGISNILGVVKPLKAVLFILLFLLIILGSWIGLRAGGFTLAERFKTFADLKADTSFAGRMLYYKAAVLVIADHPLVGIGFENFRNIYPRYRAAEDNQIFEDTIPTMVHNGYLQLALETGIPGLVLYLVFVSLVFLVLIRAYRKNKGLICLALIGSLAVYLIQDLSGWPDIALSPFFWIFSGLVVSVSQGEGPVKGGVSLKQKGDAFIKALFLIGILFLSAQGLSTLKTFYGDRLLGSTRFIHPEYDWPGMETRIIKGLEWVPRHAYYEDWAALHYINRFARNPAPETYKKAARLLDQAYKHNPFDPYALIHRIDLEQIALGNGTLSQPSEAVQKGAILLLKLDGNNRTIYKTLARLKIREKNYAEALALIDSGNLLNRGAPNPREEWTAAQHGLFLDFVTRKDFPSALKVIRQVISQYPDDVPSQVLMGNLYGAMKNWVKAREAFSTALQMEPENRDAAEGLRAVEKAGR